MSESDFKYLAIKNWKKYQPKNTLNLPWIRDYKERDFDDDYSKLTMPQRYMLDACCRLRGRYNRNIANDPLWICRATAVLPRERHNATTAIQQLISSGFLILTNQELDPLVEESKGEERGVKESIPEAKPPSQELPSDCDVSIQKIAAAHPKNLKPVATERAIVSQLDRLIEMKHLKPAAALDYLLDRTQQFAKVISGWPRDELKFVPEAHNWFTAGSFDVDPKQWEWKAKKENGNGNRKSEQSAAGTRAAVTAGVDKFLRGKNGVGAEHVSGAVAAKPGDAS